MKVFVVALVACLAQGISALPQWALHKPISYGSGSMGAAMGGLSMGGMGGMGSMGSMGALGSMGSMGGIGSLSMKSKMPYAGLSAIGTGPIQAVTAKDTWDCMRRTGGMLSMCGGAGSMGSALAAFKDDYDDTEEEMESPIGPGAGLLTIAGQIDPVLDEAAGERAMAEIRKLFGATQVPTANFEGTVTGDMEGLEKLNPKAEAMIAAAISGMPDDELTTNADTLSNNDLLDTVKSVQTAVTKQSETLVERLSKLTNAPMAKKGCAKDLVATATDLANSFSQVPERATTLVEEATVFHTDCTDKPMYQLQMYCKSQKMVPIAMESVHLAKDVNDNTAKAVELMKEMRAKLKDCRDNGIKA